MTTPEPNVPLLRKAVEWVEEQDALPGIVSEWDQGSYLMEPHYHAIALVQQAGIFVGLNEFNRLVAQVRTHCGTAYCVAGRVASWVDERYLDHESVNDVHCSVVAREALGLTHEQASFLFCGSNEAADVRRIAEEFAGERL